MTVPRGEQIGIFNFPNNIVIICTIPLIMLLRENKKSEESCFGLEATGNTDTASPVIFLLPRKKYLNYPGMMDEI